MPLTMSSSLFFVTFLSLTLSSIHAESGKHLSCTHGKLFVSDAVSGSTIHVIDLNSGSNLTVGSTVEVDGGAGANELYISDSREVVGVLYYGSEATNYTDGVVNWIHTGVELEDDGSVEYDAPTVLPNGAFDCILPLHFSANGDMIAIFCDGSYDIQDNSTIWIVDEAKLSATSTDGNAIMYNTTILSSHHGNAVLIGDDHLLYSLPTADRISRNVNGTDDELGNAFAVTDMTGTVVFTADDPSSSDTHCSGHHGIANTHHTAILACDEVHGGVLLISYDESSSAFSSRALAYPVEGHRSFHFEQYNKGPNIVGDLLVYDPSSNTSALSSFHLFAFSSDDTQLTENHAVKLPTEQYQCGFSYEKSEGNIILAFVAEGLLLAYEFESEWTELARLQVVENMTECSQAVFASGYMQAFVLTTAADNATLHAIDLSKVRTEGKMSTYATSPIDFIPYYAVVAGVPLNSECNSTKTAGEVKSDDDIIPASTSAAAGTSSYFYMMAVMGIVNTAIVAAFMA